MRGQNSIKIIFFFIFLFFCFSSISATCSIGTTPLGVRAEAKPGNEVEVIWNFYNLYGDRMTHVTINKVDGPNWEVRYDPSYHEEKYEVSGIIVNKNENVALEKSSIVLKVPNAYPKGVDYVKHPKEEGYILVKPVKIYIKIPENAELWKDYNFVFEAKGDCFSEPGVVIPALATQLNVEVVPKTDFYEKAVQNEDRSNLKITGATIGSEGTLTKIFAIVLSFFVMLSVILLIKIKKDRTRKFN